MDVYDFIKLYEDIKDKLPKTYPKPALSLYEDVDSMVESFGGSDEDMDNLYAFFDANANTISVCKVHIKTLDKSDLVKIILHELGHAYYGSRYGYHSKQFFNEEMCDKFACRWANKVGIEISKKIFIGWTANEVNYLRQNYSSSSKDDILKHINRSWSAIKQKAKSLNLNKDEEFIEHNFFAPPWRPENFWAAGYICSGNSIIDNETVKIKVMEKDIDVLNKIKTLLGYLKKPRTYRHRGKNYFYIDIKSKKIVQDLTKYFMSNSDISFTSYVNNDMVSHFMRGYADKKASYFFMGESNVSCKVSGENKFVEQFANILYKRTGVDNSGVKKDGKVFFIKYCGNRKVSKIRDFLYNNSSQLFSKRKYNILFDKRIEESMSNKFTKVVKINPITKEREEFKSILDATQKGFTSYGICNACDGRQKTHGGFIWKRK